MIASPKRSPVVSEFHAATEVSRKNALDALHSEFDEIHSPERVQQLFEDSLEQIGHTSTVEAYLPALAGRLTRERLRALGQSEGKLAKAAPEVLFVAVHDSGRGQMAAALTRLYAGERLSVSTAASGHVEDLDPVVNEALVEVGADLEGSYAKPLTAEVIDAADVVVTMARSVGEISIPESTRHLDWRVGDPGGADMDEVRRIRDDIARRVQALIGELAPHEPEDAD